MTTNFNIQEHQYVSCIECFEDTIATYVERKNKKDGLTGGEIYQAFKEAIKNQQEWHASEQQILNDLSSFF
jgi:predicted nucleotidyltransferase